MDAFVLYDASVKHFSSLVAAQQHVANDSEPATIVTEVSEITQQLAGSEILALYNTLTAPAPPVARFATARVGAQRLWKILQTRKEVIDMGKKKTTTTPSKRPRLSDEAVLRTGKAAREASVYGILQAVLSKAGGSMTVGKFVEKAAAAVDPPRSKEKDRGAYTRRAVYHGLAKGWFTVSHP